MTHPNPRATYDREYGEIRDDLLRLGDLVDTAIGRSIDSLKNKDQGLARQVIRDDATINDLRFRIEEACLALIATQQPAASDLRSVIAVMNIVVDMERMADHATGIAKTVVRMGDAPLVKPLVDIPRMADLTRSMLRRSLDAFIQRDVTAARVIAEEDHQVDHLYRAVFDELLAIMVKDPETVTRATYLLWCAHNLERIGDRVTNIAERVVFVSTGDMRELND